MNDPNTPVDDEPVDPDDDNRYPPGFPYDIVEPPDTDPLPLLD